MDVFQVWIYPKNIKFWVEEKWTKEIEFPYFDCWKSFSSLLLIYSNTFIDHRWWQTQTDELNCMPECQKMENWYWNETCAECDESRQDRVLNAYSCLVLKYSVQCSRAMETVNFERAFLCMYPGNLQGQNNGNHSNQSHVKSKWIHRFFSLTTVSLTHQSHCKSAERI